MSDALSKCQQVDDVLADLSLGIADDELLDHLASCERCRDVRYEAEQLSLLVADAASDYRFPEQLAERLLAAVDALPATAERPSSARRAFDRLSQSLRPRAASAASPAPTATAAPAAAAVVPAEAIAPSAPARAPAERAARSATEDLGAAPVTEAAAPSSATPAPAMPASRATMPRPGASPRPSARWAWLSLAAAIGLGLLWAGGRREPGESAPAARSAPRVGTWQGQVADVERAPGSPTGLSQCARGTQVCQPIGPGDVAHPGIRLETDGLTRARIQLADGSTLALDRSTRFELDPNERRRGRLLAGSVVAEIEPVNGEASGANARGAGGGGPAPSESGNPVAPSTPPASAPPASGAAATVAAASAAAPNATADAVRAVIDVPFGRAEVLGTKFSLRTGDDGTRLEVSRGSVKLIEDEQGRSAFVHAGEAALLSAGAPPRVEPATDLGSALEWSSAAFQQQPEASRGALGSLVAKRPSNAGELSDAVHLVRHDVRVRILGNIARTEIDEVFENAADEELEGVYEFPLPPGAQIERLALEVDGRFEEGAFVERERASSISGGAIANDGAPKPGPGTDGAWLPGPWRDPALLEWQRGNRLELRIFPVPKRGTRRVLLAYTEVLPPSDGQRRYVYPLPSDPRGSTQVARFSIEVQLRGHDPARPIAASGYTLATLSGSPDVARLGFDEQGFVPRGDLSLTYALANDGELRAAAYQPSNVEAAAVPSTTNEREVPLPADAPYVALSLRPTLPRRTRYEALDYVLIADTSRSMFGENYRQATRVISRLVAELDRSARFTVLGCDSTCQALPGGFLAPGEAAADATRRFLESIEPEGASDLAMAVDRAGALRPRRRDNAQPARALRVIYVGDGTPTVGPIVPALLEPAIQSALPPGASLSAIAIGSDAERGALRVATRAGGGATIAFAPGVSVEDVVYAVLGSSYGQALSDARLELPEGLVQVLPKKLGSVAAGSEQLIVARMTRPRVEGSMYLRGQVAGEPFERRYSLRLAAQSGEANAFVPRLYASVAIAELDGVMDEAARRRSIELSTRFGVPSRYTSLLVLQNPATFGAFGLSSERQTASWSGEIESAPRESATETPSSDGVPEAPSSGGPSPAAKARSGASLDAPANAGGVEPDALERDRPLLPGQPAVSMRRVWERVGRIEVPPARLAAASDERLQTLARVADAQGESRSALRELYVAQLLAGDLDAAGRVAERWAAKDPLDVEALTARADVAAQRGDRELSIRMLGSVVDVHPDDYEAQWRLVRLHRWSGQAERGCRHALAVAQLRLSDAQRVSDGIGCARDAGDDRSADTLLSALAGGVREEVERLSRRRRSGDSLSGDFRVLASWQGSGTDLDVVILHPDGYRVSWLGAPTRAVISASDVLGLTRESLALRGAVPGQYAIELVRSSPTSGTVRGSVRIQAVNAERSVPFVLEGERTRVATVTLRNEARLVPLERSGDPRWE